MKKQRILGFIAGLAAFACIGKAFANDLPPNIESEAYGFAHYLETNPLKRPDIPWKEVAGGLALFMAGYAIRTFTSRAGRGSVNVYYPAPDTTYQPTVQKSNADHRLN